ncbi:MAG: hypothetical protein HY368_02160 [Candidatus Aenigmarchaeota archaeon]|nr:hypothetical protein [Candidatus Aenigmarchaeota archaeon]
MAVFFGVDLSTAGILALLIKSVLAFLVITLADSVIGHEFRPTHTAVISLLALFAAPIVTTLMNQAFSLPLYVDLLISLIVWIIAGEILLEEADMMTKLKVMVVAYAVFTVASFALDAPIMNFVTGYIIG